MLWTAFRASLRNVRGSNLIGPFLMRHMTSCMLAVRTPNESFTTMAARSRVSDISSAISSAAQKIGYSQLKPEQKTVVEAFLKGKDVFVSLPTGTHSIMCAQASINCSL